MFVSPLNSHVEILTLDGMVLGGGASGGAQVRRVGPFAGLVPMYKRPQAESLVSSPNVKYREKALAMNQEEGLFSKAWPCCSCHDPEPPACRELGEINACCF